MRGEEEARLRERVRGDLDAGGVRERLRREMEEKLREEMEAEVRRAAGGQRRCGLLCVVLVTGHVQRQPVPRDRLWLARCARRPSC